MGEKTRGCCNQESRVSVRTYSSSSLDGGHWAASCLIFREVKAQIRQRKMSGQLDRIELFTLGKPCSRLELYFTVLFCVK